MQLKLIGLGALLLAVALGVFLIFAPLIELPVSGSTLTSGAADAAPAGGAPASNLQDGPSDAEGSVEAAPSTTEELYIPVDYDDVLRLKAAAESGDVEAFRRLQVQRHTCLFSHPTYDQFKPALNSPMAQAWASMRTHLIERCNQLRLDTLDAREWVATAQRTEHLARLTNHASRIPAGLATTVEAVSLHDQANLRMAWESAAEAEQAAALLASLRAAIPVKSPADADHVRRAIQDAGVHEEDPVLQHLNDYAPALAACIKFGECQLSQGRLAALCIVDHACFGNLPLPELLNGRIMSSADYYKLQAIVAALLAQLDRPGG